jgi:hypothetical protein
MAKAAPAPEPTVTVAWNIANLERETADGYVYTAHYTVDATDGTYSAGAYGSIGFERPEQLIPFKDLTKDQVIEWVKEALGDDKVLEIGQALLSQIEEQRQPTKQAGVPWQ